MAKKILKVQVSNLPNEVTEADLIAFFSRCGAIDNIKLERDGAESLKAIVTFRWPSAQRKALLLDGAVMLGRTVCISSLDAADEESEDEKVENLNTKCSQLQISYEELKQAKQQEEKLGLNNRGGILGPQPTSVILESLQSKHKGKSATVKSSHHWAPSLQLTRRLDEAEQLNSVLANKGKWIQEETHPPTWFIQQETCPPTWFSAKPIRIFMG